MVCDFSILQNLYDTMAERRKASPDESYTAQLLAKSHPEVARKFGEEATELIIEATRQDKQAMVSESADVLYHLLALWLKSDVTPEQVMAQLQTRQNASGLQEKANRSPTPPSKKD